TRRCARSWARPPPRLTLRGSAARRPGPWSGRGTLVSHGPPSRPQPHPLPDVLAEGPPDPVHDAGVVPQLDDGPAPLGEEAARVAAEVAPDAQPAHGRVEPVQHALPEDFIGRHRGAVDGVVALPEGPGPDLAQVGEVVLRHAGELPPQVVHLPGG